jgi:hypothetical protein
LTDAESNAMARRAEGLAPVRDNDRAEAVASRDKFLKGLAEKHDRAHALRREAIEKREEARRLFLELAKTCWERGYALDSREYETCAHQCAPLSAGVRHDDADFLDY